MNFYINGRIFNKQFCTRILDLIEELNERVASVSSQIKTHAFAQKMENIFNKMNTTQS